MILANIPGYVEGEEDGGGGAILKTSSAQGTTHSQFHNAYMLLMANNGYNSLRRLYNSVFLLYFDKNIRKSKIFTATVLN